MFDPWVRKIPWSRKWQPTLVFLPGKPHGRKSLVGCSLGGCKELDTIMTNTFTSHLGGSDCKESACKAGDLCLIPGSGRSSGEGSSNLLHHSFLENSMDRGAWWAGPRSHKKSDMMEQLTFTKTFIYYAFFSSCIYLIDTLYTV